MSYCSVRNYFNFDFLLSEIVAGFVSCDPLRNTRYYVCISILAYGGVKKTCCECDNYHFVIGSGFRGLFQNCCQIGMLGLQPVRREHMRLIGHFSPGSVQNGTHSRMHGIFCKGESKIAMI